MYGGRSGNSDADGSSGRKPIEIDSQESYNDPVNALPQDPAQVRRNKREKRKEKLAAMIRELERRKQQDAQRQEMRRELEERRQFDA